VHDLGIQLNEDAQTMWLKDSTVFKVLTPKHISFELSISNIMVLNKLGFMHPIIISKSLDIELEWLVLLEAKVNILINLNNVLLNLLQLFGHLSQLVHVLVEPLGVFNSFSLDLLDLDL